MTPSKLSVSIVTYVPDFTVLEKCVSNLKQSVKVAMKMGLLGQCRLTFVDNGPGKQFARRLRTLLETLWNDAECEREYLHSGGKVRYASGDNFSAISERCDFPLSLNLCVAGAAGVAPA